MDTARPWPSRPPEVAMVALFSIFLISTDSYYMHTHNKGLNTHQRKTLCVRESQCCYLRHLGSVCIWGFLWLTSGHWSSFRPLDLFGFLWGPGWRSFNRVVMTGHGIWQRKEHIRVETLVMANRLIQVFTVCVCRRDGMLTVCVRYWAWWSWVWSELETLRPNLHCLWPDLECELVGEWALREHWLYSSNRENKKKKHCYKYKELIFVTDNKLTTRWKIRQSWIYVSQDL